MPLPPAPRIMKMPVGQLVSRVRISGVTDQERNLILATRRHYCGDAPISGVQPTNATVFCVRDEEIARAIHGQADRKPSKGASRRTTITAYATRFSRIDHLDRTALD